MQNKPEFISIKQTWSSNLKLLLVLLQDGNKEGRDFARNELANMAKVADMMVDHHFKGVNPNASTDEVLEDAKAAFWAVITKNYPTVKTGDFSPEATEAFDDACLSAVTVWLHTNG